MSKVRVLVVDDSEPSVFMLKTLLELSGLNAVSCCSSAEAKDTMKLNQFDVVVLDYYLDTTEEVNALEMIRWMRNKGVLTPTVVHSAAATEVLDELEQKLLAEGLGPCAIIPKSRDPEPLVNDISKMALAVKEHRYEVRRV